MNKKISSQQDDCIKISLLDGFELVLTCNDDSLVIEAEYKQSSEFYEIKLNNEDVKAITKDFIETPESLLETILYACKKEDPKTNISISRSGEIIITQAMKVAFNDRIMKFCIPLKKMQLSPLQICKRYVQEIENNEKEHLSQVETQFLKAFKKVIESQDIMEKTLKQALDRIEQLETAFNETTLNQ